MSEKKFTWVETHLQLSKYLSSKENSQTELIELLKSVGIGPFNDKSEPGEFNIELEEIDPFTFFCYIYKYGGQKRLKFLRDIAKKLGIQEPNDDNGIPSAQAQKVWLFPNKYERINNEVTRLWSFYKKAIDNHLTDNDFEDVLQIRSTGKTKLTEALFYINPEKYLPINGPVKPYLKEELGIEPEFNSYTEYLEILNQIRLKVNIPFYELSYEAWKWNDQKKKFNYWIFQGNPRVFDIETALKRNILADWTVSAHKDKIKIGDRVIIWIGGDSPGCYALAEVTSEPSLRSISADDQLWKQEDKSELKAGINITHNLVNNPILKTQIDSIEELSNLKVGNQGTNFSATKEEYEAILEIIESMTQKKYWLYAPGENASKWDEFYKEGIMCLGWDQLGDLNLLGNLNEITKRIQETYKTESKSYNNALANFEFRDVIKEGDIIIPKRGRKEYLGYGFVTSGYYYDPTREVYHNCRKVSWKKKGIWEEEMHPIVLKTLTDITKYPDYVNRLIELIGIEKQISSEMNFPLNAILYGPPGTGKTFSTVDIAIRIANPEFNLEQDREIIKAEFQRLVQDGQIVFTTFHQSMSYEDFIEGIKPIEPKVEGHPVIYKVKNGILKEICERIKNVEKLTEGNLPTSKAVSNYDQLYSAFIERLKTILSELEENETHTFESRRSKVKLLSIDENENIVTTGERANDTETIIKSKLERIYNTFNSPDDIKNIEKELRAVGTDIGWTTNYYAVFKAFKEFEASIPKTTSQNIQTIKKQNYVLIIDEINRGNVSQIFGELITLIEEDKRLGKKEALEVTLPYSKERFGVPPNLYIIGTMNTADRSVEALDAALRRRFSFKEMPPVPQLIIDKGKLKDSGGTIEGIDLARLLTIINKRIEKLLDKDHLIGHSYFMSVSSLKSLQNVFQNNINPLLQEYFFGDFGKIGLVLGGGFFENKGIQANENLLADFDEYESSDLAERPVYKLLNVSELKSQEFIEALNQLMKK